MEINKILILGMICVVLIFISLEPVLGTPWQNPNCGATVLTQCTTEANCCTYSATDTSCFNIGDITADQRIEVTPWEKSTRCDGSCGCWNSCSVSCVTTCCNNYCALNYGAFGQCGSLGTGQHLVYDTYDQCICYSNIVSYGTSKLGSETSFYYCPSPGFWQLHAQSYYTCCKSQLTGSCDSNDADTLACGVYSSLCNTNGDWDCVNDNPVSRYYSSGDYITPAIYVGPRAVNLTNITMSTTTNWGAVKITGFKNNSTGSWFTYTITNPVADADYTIPANQQPYGKYFKISFSLNSNSSQSATPTINSVTLVTTPRLTNVTQGNTIAGCGPMSILYECTFPFKAFYLNQTLGRFEQKGITVICDSLGQNVTVVRARLNGTTTYTEINYTDNTNAANNSFVCST